MQPRLAVTAMSVAAVSAALGAGPPALAHPHVWIKAEALLLVQGQAIIAVQHRWRLDEGFRASVLDEFDVDRDGRLDEVEHARLLAQSRNTLITYKSFTLVRARGARVVVGEPRDLMLSMDAAQPMLEFKVPLALPVPLRGGGPIELEVFDPTFFSAVELAGETAVAFAGEAPEGCSIAIGPATTGEQMKAVRALAFQFGHAAAKLIKPVKASVSCRDTGASAPALPAIAKR